jgi:hypothetical protein
MFNARQNEIAKWVKSRQTPSRALLTSPVDQAVDVLHVVMPDGQR